MVSRRRPTSGPLHVLLRMGSNCCTAARLHDSPQTSGPHFPAHRNGRRSSSRSFQWNDRAYVDDIGDDLVMISHGNRRSIGFGDNHSTDVEIEGLSGGGIAGVSFGSTSWFKTPIIAGTAGSSKRYQMASNYHPPESISQSVDSFSEGLVPMKSSHSGTLRTFKVTSPTSASSVFKEETPPNYSVVSDPNSTRKACYSPSHISRRISDRHPMTFRSLNEKILTEGRLSNACSFPNTEPSAGEATKGSSDGWSLRLFSELVASSQRERCSFGYENMSASHGKVARADGRQVASATPADLQSCGVCSNFLKQRSSWASQKISNLELSVVSVLVCGHVYHAECLESVTSEADRFDPSCPVCTGGEKSASKLTGKGKGEIKGKNKISRNAVADINLDGVPVSEQPKRKDLENKDAKTGSSSNFRSLGRPFLRRHFSVGSRPWSASDGEASRKNFWGRHQRVE